MSAKRTSTRSCPAVWSVPRLLTVALASSLCAGLAAAQPAPASHAPDSVHERSPMAIPDTHHQVSRRPVSLDGVPAVLNRYERRDGRNAGLEGEHFSTVVAADGGLKGFANLSLDLVGKPLPSPERSEHIARAFLRDSASDLLPHMRIKSIAPHEEPIRIARAGRTETVQLAGMKLKARNTADGSWFWVIVGSDEKPMLFERDLQWSNLRFKRSTEQWLHDRWIKEQDARARG